jgi:putative tricarboxylic transport membrane protein
VIGTYSVRNSIFDVWVLLAAGVSAMLQQDEIPARAAGGRPDPRPNIEKHFREALFLSQGDPWIYVESPIAVTVWLLVRAILIAGFIARRRAAFAEAMAQESSL